MSLTHRFTLRHGRFVVVYATLRGWGIRNDRTRSNNLHHVQFGPLGFVLGVAL